jgi:hypothetical protein
MQEEPIETYVSVLGVHRLTVLYALLCALLCAGCTQAHCAPCTVVCWVYIGSLCSMQCCVHTGSLYSMQCCVHTGSLYSMQCCVHTGSLYSMQCYVLGVHRLTVLHAVLCVHRLTVFHAVLCAGCTHAHCAPCSAVCWVYTGSLYSMQCLRLVHVTEAELTVHVCSFRRSGYMEACACYRSRTYCTRVFLS